jgi:hypothetical protein
MKTPPMNEVFNIRQIDEDWAAGPETWDNRDTAQGTSQGFSDEPLPGVKAPQMSTIDLPPVKLSLKDWSRITSLLQHWSEEHEGNNGPVDMLIDDIFKQLGQKRD